MKTLFYCPKCNGTRWKTKHKLLDYLCRICGFIGVGLSNPKGEEEIIPIKKVDWWKELFIFVVKFFKNLWMKLKD